MNRTEYESHIKPFKEMCMISRPNGFIAWRMGTGNNTELLHIRTYVKRQGTGKELVLAMLKALELNPPYYSVFGFTRAVNLASLSFYASLGFDTSLVKGVYKDGEAILFSQSYSFLMEKHYVFTG